MKGVKYILCDISKKNLKYKIHHDYKYVVNVSGYVDHSNNSSIKKTHYEGCKNLVSIFEDKNISKFVQIGSCIEYGRIKSPQKEIDTKYYKNTNSNYGNAKLLSSLYLQSKFFKKVFLQLY